MKKGLLKFAIAVVTLAVGCYFVYCTPKAKYRGKEVVVSIMNGVPDMFGRWRGQDIPMKIDEENSLYNFISRVFAKFYTDLYLPSKGASFVILDAGNFHYPKICMRGGGGKTEDLPPRDIEVGGKKIHAQLVLTEYKDGSTLSVYWICIDKKVAREWIEHKAKQLVYSLFNKKSVGLMIRTDVACTRGTVDEEVKYVEKFLNDMYSDLPEESREYMFGK